MGRISEAWRLLKIAKKPDRQEVWLVIRVTAVGMIILGMIGYVIKVTLGNIMEQIVKGG